MPTFHVHQAVSDPAECIAQCPICSPGNVPAHRLEPAPDAASTAYRVFEQLAERRRAAQAARASQQAQRVEQRDEIKARQEKLF